MKAFVRFRLNNLGISSNWRDPRNLNETITFERFVNVQNLIKFDHTLYSARVISKAIATQNKTLDTIIQKFKFTKYILLILGTLFAFVAAAPRLRREAIYGGYHGGHYGGHLGYSHGVALAGPALGPTSVAGPHLGATVVAAPSIGPAKLSGSIAGPVHVSGAVAGSAVVTASVAGPAHVEGYGGPYDGGVDFLDHFPFNRIGRIFTEQKAQKWYIYVINIEYLPVPYETSRLLGLGYASPAYGYAGYPGYAGYAGHGSHGVVIAGPASHGAILAGPASHGAVLSGPHSGSAAVSGPHAGSVVIAGPSGKITTHGTGFGGIHTGHDNIDNKWFVTLTFRGSLAVHELAIVCANKIVEASY
ncbi:hypothetical protein E2986_11012 [Frieseomelitta varia]|uniref:Uncharacterized protein n=1 Tax=Frieseomelitta varia TaxID=561572 RepID=A0A833RZF1_9HYME|nr:hypothetical protein E2986_11012 [Frieseomelitta varia]